MSRVPPDEPPPASTPPATPADASARRRPLGAGFWLAAGWVVVVVMCAALAKVLPIPDADDFSVDRFFMVSKAHWLGTDAKGRDLFARAAMGARISLLIGVSTLAAGWLIGGSIGLMSGYIRGGLDAVVQYVLNLILAFPAILLALLIVTIRGSSVGTVVFALALLAIPAIARIVRASTISFAGREFVTAARTLGARPSRIITRELLPNVLPSMLTYGLVQFAVVIIAEGALTYTGNGIPPGTPSWGSMVVSGQPDLEAHPFVTLMPAAVICLTALSFNFMGDRLRERFQVRQAKI
jgi:peptide/nickel transport system permease protein